MMRKLVMLMALLLMVSVAYAQEEDDLNNEPTLADLIEAAAADENAPEFTTLQTAIQAADPVIAQTLASRRADLTLFAPTDAAFAEFTELVGEDAVEALLADQGALTEVLLYHVVEGEFQAGTLAGLPTVRLDTGSDLPSLQGQNLNFFFDGEDLFINDAQIVLFDIPARNGVLHVIDLVLTPPPPSEDDTPTAEGDTTTTDEGDTTTTDDDTTTTEEDVVAPSTEEVTGTEPQPAGASTLGEIVVLAAGPADQPEFTFLLAALEAADPALLTALLDPAQNLTLFAPTDDAFRALFGADPTLLDNILADQERITNILSFHVVEGFFPAEILLSSAEGSDLLTLLGEPLTLTGTLTGNLMVEDANVIIPDFFASNGVLHFIDAVLAPPQQ